MSHRVTNRQSSFHPEIPRAASVFLREGSGVGDLPDTSSFEDFIDTRTNSPLLGAFRTNDQTCRNQK